MRGFRDEGKNFFIQDEGKSDMHSVNLSIPVEESGEFKYVRLKCFNMK